MAPWKKEGKGGSYEGYTKARKKVTSVTKSQREVRNRFRVKSIGCKGKNQAEFRACMSK